MLTTQTLYQSSAATPLGQITLAGLVNKEAGRSFVSSRVLGSYAFVYLLEGEGIYCDAHLNKTRVSAGSLLVLFPDLAHSYGPQNGQQWRELFMVFDGPVFDLWRTAGVLNPAQPVHLLAPVNVWLAKFRSVLAGPPFMPPPDPAARALETSRFLTLLTEALTERQPAGLPPVPWLNRACVLLSADLSTALAPAAVAQALGLSYETFRKQFQEAVGTAPAHYRSQRRLAAACSLLAQTHLTNKEIAETLGFSDPFHFARRFKVAFGQTPKHYRRHSTAVK